MKGLLGLGIDLALWAGVIFGFIIGNEYVSNLTLFVLWALGILVTLIHILMIAADEQAQEKAGMSLRNTPRLLIVYGRVSSFVRFMLLGSLGYYVTASFLAIAWLIGRLSNAVCKQAYADAIKKPHQ